MNFLFIYIKSSPPSGRESNTKKAIYRFVTVTAGSYLQFQRSAFLVIGNFSSTEFFNTDEQNFVWLQFNKQVNIFNTYEFVC